MKRTSVVKAVNPGVGHRLSTLDGTNVVRLAVVVPGNDLNHVEHVTLLNDVLPTSGIQMGVRVVDPLFWDKVSIKLWQIMKTRRTFLLKVSAP